SDLDSVLAGSALSSAQSDLQSAQSDNWYIDYTHRPVNIVSVEPEDATDADQLSVQAQVTESAEVYEGDQRSEQYSYADDVVTVSYDLVREEGQWLIDSVEQP
ncbi:MAG: ARC6/PARC6 family protein, partial [Phormidesmis sp.]